MGNRYLSARWQALVGAVTWSTVAAATFAILPAAWACDTPVYRYAMFNWAPAPYRVYYFYRGELDKKDAEVNRRLMEQSSLARAPAAAEPNLAQPPSAVQPTALSPLANVVLETVDINKKDDVELLPEPVKKAWEAKADAKLPIHFVFTSWGDLISAERLDAAAAGALVGSPVRNQIARLLEKRHAAVFLLFYGKDAAANDQAEKVVQEVIARAAKGQIQIETADDDAPTTAASGGAMAPGGAAAPGAEDAGPTRPQRLQIGLVKLLRSDTAETCLVRSLSTVERDIPEAAGQPMVFPVFGRGRVLAPCIGKGITTENLSRQLELLAGPCSCNVRSQSLGVDLLFHWDWEATAEALAADQLASSDPQPIGPPGADPVAPAAASQGLPAESSQENAGTFTAGHVWKFGLGLAAIAAGVLAAGLVLVRKHRDDTP